VQASPALTTREPSQALGRRAPAGAATGLLLAQADGERRPRAVGDQFAGRVGLFLRVDDLQSETRCAS
jgi:hypothetical protein